MNNQQRMPYNAYQQPIMQRQQYNKPLGRQQVNDASRALPDPHGLIGQLMGQEDAFNATAKYTMPGGSISETSAYVTASNDFGFLTYAIVLDSAYPRLSYTGVSPDSFRNGTISFDFPRIGTSIGVSNIVAMDLQQFFLPQILTDTTLHPEYYYDQTIGIQITEINNTSNVVQPVIGSGMNFMCVTGTPSSTSVPVYPLVTRSTFNMPIPSIDRMTISFFRLSRNPISSIFEPIPLPKTNILCRYSPFPGPVNNRFSVINDTVSEFISAEAFLVDPAFITGVHMNLVSDNNVLSLATRTILNYPNGWFASSFDYVNNTFLVNGIDLSAYNAQIAAGADFIFSCMIMANRVTMQVSFIGKTGARTNDMTPIF